MFIGFLFSDHSVGIVFLKDIGLLRRTMQCKTCGRHMMWSERSDCIDGFVWRCWKRHGGTKCSTATAIRYGSWFQHSHLTLCEIMLLTHAILCREPAN
jgi:hypothetical protein